MTDKLTGKVAVVTGASSGIGWATALALAAEGAQVALLARRTDRLSELAAQITARGEKALGLTVDVADEQQVQEAIQQVHQNCGRIDILVNNAGVMLLGPIDGANTEDWRRMVDINVLGLLYVTHAVLPIMKTQENGHIVNISSVAGRFAFANSAVYNATKWGVGGFSEALRQEVFAHNIRTTIIEPGMVATELPDQITNTEVRSMIQQRWASMDILQSDDIAAAIMYAVTQPPHVNVNEILLRPTQQER